MYISPVGNKNTNFGGLWGETVHKSVRKETYSMDNILFNYYPFKDDSDEFIKQVVKDNSFEYTTSWFETGGKAIDYSKNVNIHEKLPFTKNQYQAYLRYTSLPGLKTDLQDFISNSLRERNLEQYILPQNSSSKEKCIKVSRIKRFFTKIK